MTKPGFKSVTITEDLYRTLEACARLNKISIGKYIETMQNEAPEEGKSSLRGWFRRNSWVQIPSSAFYIYFIVFFKDFIQSSIPLIEVIFSGFFSKANPNVFNAVLT
jgi:hypothetical protein